MVKNIMKKYYELYLNIKNRILSGELTKDSKLESKRIAADKYGVSTVTVEKAYSMLEYEGYVEARPRQGFFVLRVDAVAPAEKKASAIKKLPLPELPAVRDFQYSLWFKTVRKVISEQGEKLFVKAPSEGCAVLRNALSEYLLGYRGFSAQPERIIIGSGAEQLYENVVKLLGRDKIYGIEDPSYGKIRSVYSECGATVVPLKLDSDGIDDALLREKKFDVLHVTPFHSYPSGITTSVSKRYEYLRWAENNDKYVIEDDYDSEFFMPGQPVETLFSLDRRQSVIYINTFSKSLSPSMRIGYMILPEKLLTVYKEKLGSFSCSVPVMDQYVLAEFISGGNFVRHLNHMRRKMKVELSEKNDETSKF